MGWLSCCNVACTAAEDEEDEGYDEKLALLEGASLLDPRERLADSARRMHEKTLGGGNATSLASYGGAAGGLALGSETVAQPARVGGAVRRPVCGQGSGGGGGGTTPGRGGGDL